MTHAYIDGQSYGNRDGETNDCNFGVDYESNKWDAPIYYLKGFYKFFKRHDSIQWLNLCDGKKHEEDIKHEECKNEILTTNANKLKMTKEIRLEFKPELEEVFNKNNKEDLKDYANKILNSIARSVYKYGINNLDFDSNNSDWSIIDGELKKGH